MLKLLVIGITASCYLLKQHLGSNLKGPSGWYIICGHKLIF